MGLYVSLACLPISRLAIGIALISSMILLPQLIQKMHVCFRFPSFLSGGESSGVVDHAVRMRDIKRWTNLAWLRSGLVGLLKQQDVFEDEVNDALKNPWVYRDIAACIGAIGAVVASVIGLMKLRTM